MNLIIRKASVCWKGGVEGGTRSVTTESGVLDHVKFSSGIPIDTHSETDSAELIAAAHASSFSWALSQELGLGKSAQGDIVTLANVTLENLATGWTITKVHLNVVAKLPEVTQGNFIDATLRAKASCLVSKLLRANISMNAKLDK